MLNIFCSAKKLEKRAKFFIKWLLILTWWELKTLIMPMIIYKFWLQQNQCHVNEQSYCEEIFPSEDYIILSYII